VDYAIGAVAATVKRLREQVPGSGERRAAL
jgi:hypothetical protein